MMRMIPPHDEKRERERQNRLVYGPSMGFEGWTTLRRKDGKEMEVECGRGKEEGRMLS